MDYNSQRKKLVIPEYGRNIQKMVEYACSLEDRQQRTEVSHAIIQIMGRLNPNFRTGTDNPQKLWDHLFIISDYKLDVDAPYPLPAKKGQTKPERMPYPEQKIKYRYYGKTIESLIEAATKMDAGEEKEALTGIIANLMKKSYLTWNRDSVSDDVIREQLHELSGGKLSVQEGFVFENTELILSRTKKKKKHNDRNSGRRKRRR